MRLLRAERARARLCTGKGTAPENLWNNKISFAARSSIIYLVGVALPSNMQPSLIELYFVFCDITNDQCGERPFHVVEVFGKA